jgi:hypothetical protein
MIDIEAIREEPDKQDWRKISEYPLSEDFIREFQHKIWWKYVSYNSSLSENLIRDFQNEVAWKWISFRQNLSKEFIAEFYNKLDFTALYQNDLISDDVKEFCRMFV